jgi:hypothetical protein
MRLHGAICQKAVIFMAMESFVIVIRHWHVATNIVYFEDDCLVGCCIPLIAMHDPYQGQEFFFLPPCPDWF